VRDALRQLEERKHKLAALRARLAEGAAQANRSEFVHDYTVAGLIQELDNEAQ
jgi:antitoxin ParD1/3/4